MTAPAAAPSASDPNPDALARLLALTESAPTLPAAVALLRQVLPGMKVSPMDAFELRDETPVARGDRRALYLARHDGHCWALTTVPAEAGAVFVTEHGR